MPRLPIDTANGTLPTSSGIPLRVQQTSALGQPVASQDVGALGGQALAGLGNDLVTAADIGLRTQDLQDRIARAQGVLDAKTRLQDYIPAVATKFDELKTSGDYRTLPEDILRDGRAIMAEQATGLTPQAAALFREDAMQHLNVLQARAFEYRTERREGELAYTLTRAKDQARLDFESATTSADQAEAMTRYEQLNLDLVRAGLLHGDKAAKDVTEVRQLSQEILATRWVAAYPEKALKHFGKLLKNEAGLDEAPPVPRDKEKVYHDLAEQELRKAWSEQEHQEKAQEKDLRMAQETTERALTNQVWDATNIQQLLGLRRMVQRVGASTGPDGVSDEGQRRLFSTIQARITDLETPREGKSDEGTLRNLGISVLTGRGKRTAEEGQLLSDNVAAAIQKGKLRWADGRGLLLALQEEQREDAPMKLPEVRRNRDILHTELSTTSPFDNFNPEGERDRNVGLREYDDRLKALAAEWGPLAAERAAPEIAREISDTLASKTMRVVQQQLGQPPRNLPAGILNEDGLPGSPAVITQRYGLAKQALIQKLDAGEYTKDQAASHLATLDERRKWWEYVLKQQPPATPQAPPKKNWWESFFAPKPPTEGEIPRR
jgi:hypothetical protein